MPCQCCTPTTTERDLRSAATEPCECGGDSGGDCRCATEPAPGPDRERRPDSTLEPTA